MFIINLEQQLSPSYTLRDLSITSTGIPNMPGPDDVPNLRKTAGLLEHIKSKIGPIRILSAFRNKAVQGAVGSTSKKSFHELGLAVDFTPTTMSVEEFFIKMLADPFIFSMTGEDILKLPQNSIHISIGGPKKIMEMDRSKDYQHMSQSTIDNLISSFMPGPGQPVIASTAPQGLSVVMDAISEKPRYFIGAIALIASVGIYFSARKR